MVVVDAAGDVVVVALLLGAVVLVVVVADVVVVVVDEVDVVVDEVGAVVGAGGELTRFCSVVPLSEPPKIAVNGLPEISSTAVMNMSASTNTMAAVPAMAPQENRRTRGRLAAGRIGAVLARKSSVAGASASAEISRRSVSPAGAAADSIWTVSATSPSSGADLPMACVGADEADEAVSRLTPVPPSLRNNVELSGARTATCFTAACPRSIDCATKAVPMVAAAEPMATPTIVPLTPKLDAMTAAITAPAVEARI